MTIKIDVPTRQERDLAVRLREMATAVIARKGLEEAARELGLLPGGVEALLWDREWSLPIALRACEALGVTVALEPVCTAGTRPLDACARRWMRDTLRYLEGGRYWFRWSAMEQRFERRDIVQGDWVPFDGGMPGDVVPADGKPWDDE